MATSGSATDAFSGRSMVELVISVTRADVEIGNNRSRYSFTVRANNTDGYDRYSLNDYPWSVNVEGSTYSGTWTPDFRGSTNSILITQGTTGWKSHNSSGNLTVNFRATANNAGIFGSASASGSFASNRIPGVPGQPPAVVFTGDTTPTAVYYNGSSPSDHGHASLTRSQHQIAVQGAGWDNVLQTKTYPYPSGVSVFSFTGLTPGTTYAVRYRYENGDGWGPWATTAYNTTLPSGGPTISVVPAPSGGSATVTLSPPNGISGVNSYIVTRKYLRPAPVPNPATVTFTTTSNTAVVSNLISGATYQWSAKAVIGSYTSDTGNIIEVTQPAPSTNAGDYFDGNSTDTDEATYDWTGTTNLSTSTETAQVPTGWGTFASGSGTSGGTGAVSSTLGGALLVNGDLAGSRAARVTFKTDATAAGFEAGVSLTATGRADVADGGTYWGSIYIYMPRRSQRLAAEIVWLDSSGTRIGQIVGVDTLVSAGIWTRLSVIGTAPSGATFAAVRVIDVAGSGWALWRSGDTFRLDAAMLSLGELYPYFDGDTTDTNDFEYEWEGTANASVSTRTSISESFDWLNDPDCPAVPDSPRPPTVPSDCITDVGLWRRYWVSISSAEVGDWLTTIPTLELTTKGQAERQVRIRYYANPFARTSDQIDTTDYCSEQIISYIPPATVMTLDGVSERVWAEVAGGASLAADHLLYGSDGTPATWPHLSCGIGYLVSIDVPMTSLSGNVEVRAYLTQRA